MEVGERKCSSGFSKPPWIFRGRALYQLHLVKAEIARACIPKEFRLVETFGHKKHMKFKNPNRILSRYTLGGFFLASYDDNPTGVFDEGNLSNYFVDEQRWAAKVLVNNSVEACDHGQKEVGLPSRVAKFSKSKEDQLDVQVCEVKSSTATDNCNINLSTHVPLNKWMGPEIKISLPSYSGTQNTLLICGNILAKGNADCGQWSRQKLSVLSINETDEPVAGKIVDGG